jgi:integrase
VTLALARDDGDSKPPSQGGRHAFRTPVGLRRSAPLARDPVRIPPGPAATENKGLRYPPDPRTVEEIIAVMRTTGDRPDGLRLRGVIVVLWRAGLRISEGLALAEGDLDRTCGAVLARRGKGGKRREVGMDRWALEQVDPWLKTRAGAVRMRALLCVPRTHPRPPLLSRRDPNADAKRGCGGRRQPGIRAGPAPPRSRSRDVPQRDRRFMLAGARATPRVSRRSKRTPAAR